MWNYLFVPKVESMMLALAIVGFWKWGMAFDGTFLSVYSLSGIWEWLLYGIVLGHFCGIWKQFMFFIIFINLVKFASHLCLLARGYFIPTLHPHLFFSFFEREKKKSKLPSGQCYSNLLEAARYVGRVQGSILVVDEEKRDIQSNLVNQFLAKSNLTFQNYSHAKSFSLWVSSLN